VQIIQVNKRGNLYNEIFVARKKITDSKLSSGNSCYHFVKISYLSVSYLRKGRYE